MLLNKCYPPEYVREMSMKAFEIVIKRLKDQGLEDLAEDPKLL